MKVFFSGHRDFGNRGCEAIVRSTVSILRSTFAECTFFVPSTDISRDSKSWPDASEYGVKFIPLRATPAMRVFGKLRRRFGVFQRNYPPVSLPAEIAQCIRESDVVLAVGGDNYSEDYALPYLPVLMDRDALRAKKPLVLWGASVGPFESDHNYKAFMKSHLGAFPHVFVRERLSEEYCRTQLAISSVKRFADPAFCLEKSPDDARFQIYEGCIGVNVSPLILKKLGEHGSDFLVELSMGLKECQHRHGGRILLIPHVSSYSGPNRDEVALDRLAGHLRGLEVEVEALPSGLNSVELKSAISKCRVFIGARTHATIAAMSQLVPVVSIGYSVKATGINQWFFGDDRFVLDYRELTADELAQTAGKAISEHDRCLDQWQSSRDEAVASSLSAGAALKELL